jgi:hypothetical protein
LLAPQNITYLRRTEIDVDLWNACIAQAANGLPYALSSFLDAACPQWSALIQGNYNAVMPLPGRQKWGIPYLYQPFLVPALGVFSRAEEQINADPFLKAIPGRYRLWDVTLNAANKVHAYSKWAIARTNYVLPLQTGYDHTQKGYHQNIRRDLEKARKAQLVIKRAVPFADVIAIAAQQYPQFTKVEDRAFDRVLQVCNNLQGNMHCCGVYSKGLLIAACVLLFFRNRLIYWLPANRPESRTCGASAFLIDGIIKDFSGQNMILDFEGSDNAGVALFYQKFGAVPEKYTSVYYNKLFFPFSRLKKMPAYYRQIMLQKAQKESL